MLQESQHQVLKQLSPLCLKRCRSATGARQPQQAARGPKQLHQARPPACSLHACAAEITMTALLTCVSQAVQLQVGQLVLGRPQLLLHGGRAAHKVPPVQRTQGVPGAPRAVLLDQALAVAVALLPLSQGCRGLPVGWWLAVQGPQEAPVGRTGPRAGRGVVPCMGQPAQGGAAGSAG